MHIGSLAGVPVMSGRQLHSFVPLRRTGISSPSLAGQSRMVASFAIARGAALIAFWIFQAFVRAGFFIVLLVVVGVVVFFVSSVFSGASGTAAKIRITRTEVSTVPSRLMTVLLSKFSNLFSLLRPETSTRPHPRAVLVESA